MCGIFGIYGHINKKLIQDMSNTLKHRGPDDVGFFLGENIALGNRRLSIIDLGGGHQPMGNEDSSMLITFNGEIYNFQKLRSELEKLGHKFYTNSDTEVIVHSYEEWGENCVERFNGMWAFAIWDSKKEQLFLSRDRFGVKPLYYYWNGVKLLFASEIKALLQDRSIKKMPNERMIYQYLVHSSRDSPEETFFEEIKILQPAHNMIVNKNKMVIHKYWNLKVNEDLDSDSKRDKDYATRFYELFEDSVRLRLVSDVPVGTCLSGGLDSSSIVYVINHLLRLGVKEAKQIGKIQKTFSAVYDNKEIDERKYVEEIVEATTNIEKNYVFPSEETLWRDLGKLVYYQDEPFLGSSIFAQWCVMKLASGKVKVVLDGQGGDELLAGYVTYYGTYLRDLWNGKKIFRLSKEILCSLDLMLPFFRLFFLRHIKGFADASVVKQMLNSDFVSNFCSSIRGKREDASLAQKLHLDITERSVPELLRYEDRNSMAFSIEARVPFLDYRLVECVFSLPVSQRLRSGWTKYILRNAMKGKLPETIRKRRNKIGFATPEAIWLKRLKDEIRSIFASESFRGRKYFNQNEVLEKFNQFCAGQLEDEYAKVFWRMLNLEIWLEVFFPN